MNKPIPAPSSSDGSTGVLRQIATGIKPGSGAPPPPTGASGVKRPPPPLVRRPGQPTGSPNITTLLSTAGPMNRPGGQEVPRAVKAIEEASVEPAVIARINNGQALTLGCKSDEYEKWMNALKEEKEKGKQLSYEELFGIADFRLQACKNFIALYLAKHAVTADVSYKTAFAAAKASRELVKSGMSLPEADFLHAWHIMARHLGQCSIQNQGGTGFGGQPPENVT